jgi:hypothetical protein
MIDIKSNLLPIQGVNRVERVGRAGVAERLAFMHGFEQIEAGIVHTGGAKIIVAVRWSTMAPKGSEIQPVSIADFPTLILPRFSSDYQCPPSDERHRELIGLH